THVLTERDTVVLADFTNTTGESVFDDTLRHALAVQLEQSPFLSLVSDQRIQETLHLMEKAPDTRVTANIAREVCQRTESSAVIEGSIAKLRGSYSLSVGGSRANSTDWLFDGIDNNELTAGGIAILPSIDAIQEFKVLTFNYSAEYGTRAGPTVLITTKSGSNQFHGSLFEFFRNTSLDARSFFAAN